jgi:putative sterol carrier protein
MSYVFPSEAWIRELRKKINASEDYKRSAANWEAGDICLVVNKEPSIGLKETYHIWLDLYHGECRKAKRITPAEAKEAKFTITGDFDKWKDVFNGRLHPIKGMMWGKLKVKGDLFTIIRYTQAALDLVQCASQVPTTFYDEKE